MQKKFSFYVIAIPVTIILPVLCWRLKLKYQRKNQILYIPTLQQLSGLIAQNNYKSTQNNSISNWNTYRNQEFGFEVRYPESWEYKELTMGKKIGRENKPDIVKGISFGTKESFPGGYIWGIDFYDNPQEFETISDQTGTQFPDRIETREQLEFNNIKGILISVAANEGKWISKKIFFSKNNILFVIGNGAMPNYEKYFADFYSSFRFIQ